MKNHNTSSASFSVFYLSLIFTSQILAQDVIQPKQYRSNNDNFTLHVSPVSPDGINGADYSLQKNDQLIWQKQLQSTAVMADVADTGETIICAYSRGLEPPFDRNNRDHFGYMHLSLMDTSGQLIWSQSIKRRMGLGFHKPPVPFCEQVMIHPQSSRAFYWYHQDQRTQLKTIDINTGKSVEGIDFSLEHARDLTSIKDIKFHDIGGSDLLLVEITGRVNEKNEKGNGYYGYVSDALYYLLDSSGQVYWQQHLMGSLDIRKTTPKNEKQKAYRKRDAYLKANDLIKVKHEAQQFAITDYNAKKIHWYQLSKDHQVKTIKTEPLEDLSTPFTVMPDNQSNPKLLHNIDLSMNKNAKGQPCDDSFDAIDVTADGVLLLYNEDSHNITRLDDSGLSTFITVPPTWVKDDSIPHQLMFVGQSDQIFVNLGEASYAVYDANGQYLETQVWQKDCGEFCFTDLVMQKNTGKLWLENRGNKVILARRSEEGYVPEITTKKDANGHWFEYIYEMQSDQQGRLLLLGNTDDNFNQLYVLNAKGDSVNTLDLGYYYSSAATISSDLAFISEAKNDEIAVLNFSGELLTRFKTKNGQYPYLLRASHDKLYAVTMDALFVYDISSL